MSDSGSDAGRRESVMFVPPPQFMEEEQEAPEEEEWSYDHARLLYLVSLYAKSARTPDENEGWIRQVPLLVMMYEAICAQALDFDYAPASMLVSHLGASRRIWLNITQEGKAAIDDLRERAMINGLKLSTEDFQPVTAYQVSEKGMSFLDIIPQDLKDAVDAFTSLNGQLVTCNFDGEEFHLKTEDGTMVKTSTMTETEDVSYVSSPFLPSCLRAKTGKSRAFTSNAHRAHESSTGASNIQDELSEAVILGEVHGMVGEWIPFGSNQIVALNERLGALDRCQGGLFTAAVDKVRPHAGLRSVLEGGIGGVGMRRDLDERSLQRKAPCFQRELRTG